MLFSHRFGSVETLSRAQYWLIHHGFEVVKPDEASHDTSRLTLSVEFSQASAALALIDSIESSDPDGWPANTTPRSQYGHAAHSPNQAPGQPIAGSGTPIHWHAREQAPTVDPVSSKVSEYMFSRWE